MSKPAGTYCVVNGCPNKGNNKVPYDPLMTVRFHRFPSKDDSPELHSKWLEQIGLNRPNFTPSNRSVVCSVHFKTEDFEWKESLQTMQLKARFFPGEYHPPAPVLKITAIPSLHMGEPPAILHGKRGRPRHSPRPSRPGPKNGGLGLPMTDDEKLSTVQSYYINKSYKHLKNIKETKFVDKGIQCELGKETYRSQPGVISICNDAEGSPRAMPSTAEISKYPVSFGNVDEDSGTSEDSYQVTSSEQDSESEFSSINDYEEDEILTTSIMGINEEKRARKNDWCKCGVCVPMNTEYESNCCHDCEAMIKVRETFECITLHESFESVVLNVHTLNTTRHYMVLNNASSDAKNELKTKTNRLLRHIAYKQFIHWVNSWVSIGHNQVKVIPACVINMVRNAFPETNGIYMELKPAKRGYEPDYFD